MRTNFGQLTYNGTVLMLTVFDDAGVFWDESPVEPNYYSMSGGNLTVDLEALFFNNKTLSCIYGANNASTHNFDFTTIPTHKPHRFFSYFDEESLFSHLGIVPVVPNLYPSLNGNGSEFIDGVQVNVLGRETVYSVTRSSMGLVQDNSYTVLYDLLSDNGSKLTVPESLLEKYIAPVVVP